MEDDRLVAAAVERPARPDAVGDLLRARVAAVAPAMAGAFLALPDGLTGFLPDSENGLPNRARLEEGRLLGVRVTRAAQGGKGPRLTARLDAAESAAVAAAPPGAPRLVRRGPDAVLRIAAAHPGVPVEVDGAPLAGRLRAALGRDRVALLTHPAFDDALEAEFDELAGPAVALPKGGRLLIHPTPALTAIDVDAGAAAGDRDPAAPLRLNRDAAGEVARQIRLRELSGPILVDFAGLTQKRRAVLLEPLREALAADPMRPRLLGLTGLGFAEIVRPRRHPPLHEVLGWPVSPLTHGLAALRRVAREAAARPGRPLSLRASPAVLAALQGLPGALDECRDMIGAMPVLVPDPMLPPGREQIEEANR
nr:ribonuclease E/G [Roseomonas acroporae]